MVAKVFLGCMIRESRARSSITLNGDWPRHLRFCTTSPRTFSEAQDMLENMKANLNFERFKAKKVESFETFNESPEIKKFYNNDIQKIKQAYADYCLLKFNRYKQSIDGGNPATIL